MPVFSLEEKTYPGYLQEYTTPNLEAKQAAFDSAFEGNVTQKLGAYLRVKFGEGGNLLSKQDAEKRFKDAGETYSVSDSGMRDTTVDYLIERRYQEQLRNFSLQNADQSLSQQGMRFGASLMAGFLDPLNVGSAFIPVVGEERLGAWFASAGSSAFKRAAVRAGAGAIEGAVGAAALEPAQSILSRELQEDYTFTDSLANITFGAFLGATLHSSIGAVVDRLSPEAKTAAGKSAIAQALDDKPINVSVIGTVDSLSAQRVLQERLEIGNAPRELVDILSDERLPISQAERLEAARSLDPESFKRLDEIQAEKLALQEKAKTLEPEVTKATENLNAIDTRLAEVQKELDSPNIAVDKARELGAEEVSLLKQKQTIEQSIAPKRIELTNIQGGIEDYRSYGADLNRRLAQAYREAGVNLEPRFKERVRNEVKTAVETPKDANFIKPDVIEKQATELKEIPQKEDVELVNKAVQEETALLKAQAEEAGISFDDVSEANAAIDSQSKDLITALKNLTNCSLIEGV